MSHMPIFSLMTAVGTATPTQLYLLHILVLLDVRNSYYETREQS
jgi:hypothetical protein